MSQYYNQSYTQDQIESILSIIHECVRCNRYIIAKNENRAENIDFINNYNLKVNKQKDILLRIEPTDFCHTLQNTKLGFEYEILYVFCPQIPLLILMALKRLLIFILNSTLLIMKMGNKLSPYPSTSEISLWIMRLGNLC